MAATPEEKAQEAREKERDIQLRQQAFSTAQSQKKEGEDILVLAEQFYKFLSGK